ncbi:unnamed protein product [Nezara viridula]|uniref:DDB1- and CUL4-associated factor 15 WD40 repeat-containing domain-containing protein n=1 Tax=Nezara viridula TaxID=85310 RepID=A0A9P0H5B4_NEZVI|nr:unnamed protein product [Nezara viridula]
MNHSKYRKQHLLQKLYNREVYGHFVRGVPLNYEPAKQLFNAIPRRLIFKLADTIPNLDNHILMGVTRCGQLLLTYTYSCDTSSDYSPNMVYRYRLHFWEFIPGRPAGKIAEVQLFDSCTVTEILTIGICQWANNNDRLLVYGFCHGPDNTDGWGTECEYKSTTYITVTTVPTLNGCLDCISVAASFDEEEMAANWDSCVGLTCLKHGLTLHTHFSVPHVNTFDPHTCMASDSEILVNTGAFLHVISLRLDQDTPEVSKHPEENIISLPIVNRMSYSFLRSEGYSIFLSENWSSRMTNLLIEKIKKGYKYEMADLPLCLKLALERHLQINSPACNLLREVKTDLVYSELTRPKQKWFTSDKANRISSRKRQSKRQDEPDKVYDFKESEENQCEPKFKLFRRRCLADKMYEFRGDEEHNVENIRPQDTRDKEKRKFGMKLGDISKTEIAEQLKSPERTKPIDNIVGAIIADWDSDTENVVGGFLTNVEARCQALRPHNSPATQVFSSVKPQPFILSDEMREEINSGFGHQRVTGCSVKFTRRFIEIDQEITSTITDIEDDELGSGFHCALPLSVHGSAYAQLEMISNQKAEKLVQQGVKCAVVDQSSLDIEQFCFKAAEAICKMEGYKFWFCSDYDTDIIWMCPYTSDVVGVLFIRMNAEECNRNSSNDEKERLDVREFYEASCLYVWSPHSGEVHLEGYRWGSWGPAAMAASQLRRAFQPPSSVRAVIHRVEEGIPVLPLNLILDHDNLIGFRRLP